MVNSRIKRIILLFFVIVLLALPLSLVTVLAHEGGHGLLVVPAIVLNKEIPAMLTEQSGSVQEWNPFQNFPAGIFLFFLSFPLGVVANGLISWLAYRNARTGMAGLETQSIVFGVFLCLCIMNFKSAVSNIFGQDFSFVIDAVKFPYESDFFRHFLKIVTYAGLPLFMARKGFDRIQLVTVSAATFIGTYVTGLVLEPLVEVMMSHFWWLFIIGLPVFIGSVTILWRQKDWKVTKSE